MQTVPPAGVRAWHDHLDSLRAVKAARADALKNGPSEANKFTPAHTLVTRYRYNTLNQVVMQQTPDAGISRFWYDALGRLVVSQNAEQALTDRYSYTVYDPIGRIIEVGQKPKANGKMNQNITRDSARLANWLRSKNDKEQITRTVYDVVHPQGVHPLMYQRNLRNRVSFTQVFDAEPPGKEKNKWDTMQNAATYYTYDIHGNVDTLVQDYHTGAMGKNGNRFKRIAYKYDLISGKVNKVRYQPGAPDAFYHRYSYDAENRLTDVETSTDDFVYEKDARYSYYKHGPLARTILGQNQVQGIDYAYTLQGWLKGVNSTAVGDGSFDMGGDGRVGGKNKNIARDVYGFSLNYFNNDYKPIGGANPFAAVGISNNLYNGNINAMVVNIPKLGDAKTYGYKYDQLNRLVAMDAYNGLNNATNAFSPVKLDEYKERVSYDANGNIKSYLRNGSESSLKLNDYRYQYFAGTNRLQSITNEVNQTTKAYNYDAVGNTIRDDMQNVDASKWNVYGKLQEVTKSDGTNIRYTYDASGQRISKTIGTVSEWYVRDATGNIMMTYRKDPSMNGGRLSTSEYYKYGSNLLSIKQTVVDVESLTLAGSLQNVRRGEDGYLLTDHSGNTRVIISDKKVQHSTHGITVAYYAAEVKNANYYSTYGAISKTTGEIPVVAFNGQRKSTEISANAQTAEFWE